MLGGFRRVNIQMNKRPNLIVMITHNDRTAENAYEIFEQCKDSKIQYWGFKEEGISSDEMKRLYSYMKSYGKTTVLEVVQYSEKECMNGAKMAVECGCDILMGTMFYDSVNDFCKIHNLKYMPFVGKVKNRPSVLDGDVEEMINEANLYLKNGVYGFDLLGYRYTGNANDLIKNFISKVDAPICVAGNINSFARLDEIKNTNAWAFTIGGAFFENKFGDDFDEQINKVYQYINDNE